MDPRAQPSQPSPHPCPNDNKKIKIQNQPILLPIIVFAWYHIHSLPVYPINPSRPTISVPSKTYEAIPSASALPHPSDTALSFLTPPPVTRKVLAEAKAAGVKAIWLQPGSFEPADLEKAMGDFESVIGGFEDGTVGGEGWCVLVDGENSLREAGRKWKGQKL